MRSTHTHTYIYIHIYSGVSLPFKANKKNHQPLQNVQQKAHLMLFFGVVSRFADFPPAHTSGIFGLHDGPEHAAVLGVFKTDGSVVDLAELGPPGVFLVNQLLNFLRWGDTKPN